MKTNQKNERKYYLDWLRILLISTVFLFHVGMIFNNFEWHIKSEKQFSGLSPIMSFLHLWRMPLLFLISGAGTYYALGKRKVGEYIKERFKRLLIPLVAGIFILVPVQVYIERVANYESLFHYYFHMFDGVYPAGNFSWHHLWFIAYLLLISLIISPLLGYLNTRSFRKFRIWLEKLVRRPGGMNLIILPLLASQLLLKPVFPEETHDVVNDWAFISFNLIFFLAGFLLFVNPRVINHLRKQRKIYLVEFLFASLVWFSLYGQSNMPFFVSELINITVAWSSSVTAIAFAASFINRNTGFRKLANEAIYPFYLLHQPVIVVFGYFILKIQLSIAWEISLILCGSLVISIGIYWFLVRPFNAMRILFGMKKRKQKPLVKTTKDCSLRLSKEMEMNLQTR
jgi:peptidoglycan/LPS O-acetylase OafA/YrhL